MNQNDILTRVRYALDIKDQEMVEIFTLGGLDTTKETVQAMLAKVKNDQHPEGQENEYVQPIDNHTLESFLNGLVTSKRGLSEENPKSAPSPFLMSADQSNVNNVLLKKVKIALSLTSDDMMGILELAGVTLSKSELSAVLRKEGHRNYKECGDRYARNFLKGLALWYRHER